MARRPPDPPDTERIDIHPDDVLDAQPPTSRATTQLERSFGPSCLLSLIIVLLLVVVLKRYLQLPWTALAFLVFFIWFGVLTLLVRWRPDKVFDEDA